MTAHSTATPQGRQLRFTHLERVLTVQPGDTLFQSARRSGVRIVGACGGRGTCGSCSVRVVEGKVESTTAAENPPDACAGPGPWRRACQLRVLTDCTIEISPRSLAPVVRADVESSGSSAPIELDALVHSVELRLPPPSLDDPVSDAQRVQRALGAPGLQLDLAALRELPRVARAHAGALRAHLRGDELIGVAAPGSATLGLAVDLGTTNVAAFLIDLQSGQRLASLAIENPQTAWGADVISRVNHAVVRPEAGTELREAAVTAIFSLADDLCREVGAAPTEIVDVAVCGNTAMQHLLLGLPVAQLGRAPFVAAVRQGLDVRARELGLAICVGASLHVAPGVGGFVGGDHVSALLATRGLWGEGATSLVMDIGTNTEISLIHQGRILSASCPSGPALEGGHISCGMRAAQGAVERVVLADDGSLALKVIGDRPPVGVCGSGVLDTMAALLGAGMVDQRGRLDARHPAVSELQGMRAARLADGVSFSQDDVRAVQLAKAAIRTGVELLLREGRLQASDIAQFIIAGAFGAYVDVRSGIATGLFPPLPAGRFVQVGNAAGMGVQRMLASRQAREEAAQIAAGCRYIELSTLAGFQKAFLHHIGFNRPGGGYSVTETEHFNIRIIGERINPGFRSSKALFDESDLPGIQALAVKQAQAGASWLNVNIGARALTDPAFLTDVIQAIQAVVTLPLSFDVPGVGAHELCLQVYDPARAAGALPVVNSITEHRWDAMSLYRQCPFKVIVMASERMEDGVAKNNKNAADIAGTAKRAAQRLQDEHGMALDDIFIDLSVSAIVADTEGLNRSTLEAVRLIGSDPELKGLHMMGGLSNIGQQLPAKAADGSDLKHGLENAFLTLAVPHGFDTVLGTPWRGYAPLPEDNYVLMAYRNFLEQTGSNALRAVRKLYKA